MIYSKLFFLCNLISFISCSWTDLNQTDFDNGTYFITQSGKYRLTENITFSPNAVGTTGHPDAYDSNWADANQQIAEKLTLGFFAAISILADDVELDLNGYSIVQSEEHALLQRFYAHIELADVPFIPQQGPHTFSKRLNAASDVKIKNGILGRSSHHGIHGNGNQKVKIRDVTFIDYEVAAIALNGAEEAEIKDCTILRSRRDVPVYGTFSAARFIQRYVDYLTTLDPQPTFNSKNASQIKDALRTSINNVYEDIVTDDLDHIDRTQHPDEWALYDNDEAVVDGNAYGILFHRLGVAVNGFPNYTSGFTRLNIDYPSRFNKIEDTTVDGVKANIREILALQNQDKAVIDVVGSVVQFFNKDHDGNYVTISTNAAGDIGTAVYTGNAVTDAQLLVAKAVLSNEFCDSGLQVRRNNVPLNVVQWAESGSALDNYVDTSIANNFRCNGDTMFHVNKGVIGIKADNINDISIRDVVVSNIENLGEAGIDTCLEAGDTVDTYFSHPLQSLPGYGGAVTRGISVSGSQNVEIRKTEVTDITSANGDAYGVDIFMDSRKNELNRVQVKNVSTNASGRSSIGYHFGFRTKNNDLDEFCAENVATATQDDANAGANTITNQEALCDDV